MIIRASSCLLVTPKAFPLCPNASADAGDAELIHQLREVIRRAVRAVQLFEPAVSRRVKGLYPGRPRQALACNRCFQRLAKARISTSKPVGYKIHCRILKLSLTQAAITNGRFETRRNSRRMAYEWDIERYLEAQDRKRSTSVTLLSILLIHYFLFF